jgi:hypothetical protein
VDRSIECPDGVFALTEGEIKLPGLRDCGCGGQSAAKVGGTSTTKREKSLTADSARRAIALRQGQRSSEILIRQMVKSSN